MSHWWFTVLEKKVVVIIKDISVPCLWTVYASLWTYYGNPSDCHEIFLGWSWTRWYHPCDNSAEQMQGHLVTLKKLPTAFSSIYVESLTVCCKWRRRRVCPQGLSWGAGVLQQEDLLGKGLVESSWRGWMDQIAKERDCLGKYVDISAPSHLDRQILTVHLPPEASWQVQKDSENL